MTQSTEQLIAPEFQVSQWLNTDSDISLTTDLKGKVVLLDFWDYTCISSLHTLPYIRAWHDRYKDAGLVIISIHSPQFSFANAAPIVQQAISDFHLSHPIGLDSGQQTWQSYAHPYWPALFLIDEAGVIRYPFFGEGHYTDIETALQALLKNRNPSVTFPEPLPPIRIIDRDGVELHPVTADRHFGNQRDHIANPGGLVASQVHTYTMPERYAHETLNIGGQWKSEEEYLEHADETQGAVALFYQAAEVKVVMGPTQGPARVYLAQDEDWLPRDQWGQDVEEDPEGRPMITVDRPRLYHVVKNPVFGLYHLMLTTTSPGLRFYQMAFVTGIKM